MENIVEAHRKIFIDLETKANEGVMHLREFTKVLQEKME